jgi:hypothetical protein|tara:strand:- start:2368 stop:2781 length:414 start_codon:yes stop_codon:yes gene_type:complete
MSTLAYFNARQSASEEAIAALSTTLDVPTVRELIVCVKTLELMEDYANATGYTALIEKLVGAARTVMTQTLAQDDMMYVARAISFGSTIALGSELRWQLQNQDSHNIDINGEVVAGQRTIESFGDVVLETFYAASAA